MNTKFMIFVIIIFTIYFLANAYLFLRGWHALSSLPSIRVVYSIIFIVSSLSFIVMMFGEGRFSDTLIDILHPVGSTWLAVMLYAILITLFIDIVRVVDYFMPFFPKQIIVNYAKTKLVLFALVTVAVGIICIVGHYRFLHPTVTKLEINVAKKAGTKKELRVVMASDIHLGHSIKQRRLKAYVEQINLLKPDIILFSGDVIDRDLQYVIKKDIGVEFKNLNPQFGIYAVLGNHEYISQDVEGSVQYIKQKGINMLRDEVALIDSSFYIIGRDDHTNGQRKPLSDIVAALDKSLPIIMLDHQPYHLEEAENAGIDLQLSGHTHDGQLFPLNYVTRWVYEVSYGYKKKGNTHVYVSSGLGLWGPAFRVGTKSEIVDITLRFE